MCRPLGLWLGVMWLGRMVDQVIAFPVSFILIFHSSCASVQDGQKEKCSHLPTFISGLNSFVISFTFSLSHSVVKWILQVVLTNFLDKVPDPKRPRARIWRRITHSKSMFSFPPLLLGNYEPVIKFIKTSIPQMVSLRK